MRLSSIGKYNKALKLRLAGNSEGEIKKVLGIPKSTLSNWFKNLELPLSAKKILERKGNILKKQLAIFNKRRSSLIKAENKDIKAIFSRKIGKLSKRELMLIGAALYWGEGYRIEIQRGSPMINFANSDPEMIMLFIRFLQEILMIPKEKIKPKLQLFGNINTKTAVRFWSKKLSIPEDRFYVYSIISKSSKRIRPKNFLPFGTLQVNVSDRRSAFKIQGLINGLVK